MKQANMNHAHDAKFKKKDKKNARDWLHLVIITAAE